MNCIDSLHAKITYAFVPFKQCTKWCKYSSGAAKIDIVITFLRIILSATVMLLKNYIIGDKIIIK